MKAMWVASSICLVVAVSAGVSAGTLSIGAPIVENNQYTIPIVLGGTGEAGVAALDFRLAYDPAVFSPVAAMPGPAALGANKAVSANVAGPGDYKVVMMGFNQATVGSGEIARIVMERIGDPAPGGSRVAITEPTLATAGAVELPVQGSARTLIQGKMLDEGEEPTVSASSTDPVKSEAETAFQREPSEPGGAGGPAKPRTTMRVRVPADSGPVRAASPKVLRESAAGSGEDGIPAGVRVRPRAAGADEAPTEEVQERSEQSTTITSAIAGGEANRAGVSAETGPVTIESASNRVSVPVAARAVPEEPGKQSRGAWRSTPLVVLAAVAAGSVCMGLVVLRRKLFG